MAYVDEELMEQTWRRIGAASVQQATKLQRKHFKAQKMLTRFVQAQLIGLPEESASVGLYVYHVVLEAFLSLTPAPASEAACYRADVEFIAGSCHG